MSGRSDKEQTINDHAAFVKALLPQVRGMICHDRKGKRFWEKMDGRFDLSMDYDLAVEQVLRKPSEAALAGRVELGKIVAFIYPMLGDQNRLLGVLTVMVDSKVDLSHAACGKKIQPAIRALQRELSLRYRLMTSYKKLDVQSAEENLLHQVEKLVHSRRPSHETLSHILLLCRKFLNVGGAGLLVPEKHIRVFEGDALSPTEASLLLSDFAEKSAADYRVHEETQSQLSEYDAPDMLALPVRQGREKPFGILALSGWGKSAFSSRRRRRIAGYVVAHIEEVIARDYDGLTGLMSYPLFENELITACRGVESESGDHFVLCFDIDQLHVINETLGRETGDEVIAAFGQLLRERLGGHLTTRTVSNGFAALVARTDQEQAKRYADEICQVFAELEYVRGDQKIRPTVSIGVGPVTGESTANAILSPAQVACKAAKDRGRGRVELYQPGDVSIVQRLDDIQLVGNIRSAIEHGRLALAAQPIVDLKEDRGYTYFEVLVRLVDSGGSHVLPSDFFSAAERYQLMEELDRWVVTNTLKTIREEMSGHTDIPLRVAINLSGQSLGSEKFLPFISSEIIRSGVAPKSLCFEITETVAVNNLQQAQNLMHELKKLGCSFSLDDFGTGLSSFSYLKLFPVDTLKIDGSFVQDLTTNVVSQSVVAAISEVARVMKLDTVAEYVQDEKSLALLRDLGVTWGQGYLLGEPEPLKRKLAGLCDTFTSKSRLA